jgi:hypothetical protein
LSRSRNIPGVSARRKYAFHPLLQRQLHLHGLPAHCSPRSAPPSIRFLFIGSRLRSPLLSAPTSRSDRFPGLSPCGLLGVDATFFPGGIPPPCHVHAGHTKIRRGLQGPLLFFCCKLLQLTCSPFEQRVAHFLSIRRTTTPFPRTRTPRGRTSPDCMGYSSAAPGTTTAHTTQGPRTAFPRTSAILTHTSA